MIMKLSLGMGMGGGVVGAVMIAVMVVWVGVSEGQDLKQQFLDPHNQARAEVGVGALQWDDTVAAYAQSYADQRRGDCALMHSGSTQYGENQWQLVQWDDTVGVSEGQDLKQQFLDPHNQARAEVGVGALQWDDTVAAYAQSYADQRRGDCSLMHSGSTQYGENLFEGSGRDYSPGDAVNAWVSEKQFYDYNTNTCAAGQVCGHYMQVVWRNSDKLGCARVVCSNGAIFITCNYSPPGNVAGQKPY